MDILVCPVCKGDLKLMVDEEDKVEIVTGSLFCAACNVRHLISETILNLLPSDQISGFVALSMNP